jgi:hypothetical protein
MFVGRINGERDLLFYFWSFGLWVLQIKSSFWFFIYKIMQFESQSTIAKPLHQNLQITIINLQFNLNPLLWTPKGATPHHPVPHLQLPSRQ